MKSTIAPIEERRTLGIILILVAFSLFTAIDSSAKWLGAAGIPTTEFIFVRYAVHFALIVGFFLPTRRGALLRTSNIKLEVLRGLALLSSTICNFVAVQYLPLTMTSSIAFTMPLILCALSVPLLGESVGWRRWTAIGVGFIGILIIVRPGTTGFHPAAILSLFGAIATAFYFLLTRKLASVDSAATQQFYTALVAVICVIPFALGKWVWPSDAASWSAFLIIGLAGMVGHQLSTIAHRFAPASTLAPFAYFQIVYMSASSWFVFHQPPDIGIFIGAPIVIGSGLYIWLRERRLSLPVTPVAETD
jgi:drug/metabolite transporter (DMT)-like permease